MIIPQKIPSSDQKLIEELLESKPEEFTDLTQTQFEAFNQSALDDENHLLVAETGNGKTLVAEAVTKKALERNNKVAYLVPSVALVNDKFETIKSWAPPNKQIEKRNGYTRADVIVATFESYFEAIIRGYAGQFDCIILDDFHEIYSDHRGATIEKGISSALNPSSNQKVFGLSATLGNADEIAEWMDAKLTISTEDRAVPIEERPVEKTDKSYAKQIANIIQENPDKGPFLTFCDTTSHAEARARGIAAITSFDTPDDIDFHQLINNSVSTELTDTHQELIKLLRNGIGYHHGQMESELKDQIEQLAEDGIIKCITCTTSLSYGFDSPVQSVIVADLKRWDNGTMQFIGQFEYVQMIGRAGRDSARYDKAYAFPMYSDEQAAEIFQFETPVEEKQIEDVESHLKGSNNLRWLILELVNYGWEEEQEVLDFIQSTFYYSEAVDQAQNPAKDPATEIHDTIKTELEWLCEQDLISKVHTSTSDKQTYRSTESGAAFVEFEHSNWFDNTIQELIDLSWWLNHEHEEDTLTPERLIDKLAGKYYHCEAPASIDHDTIEQQMEQHDLYDRPGATAALICWFWTSGVSVRDMESQLNIDDLSTLPSTANNLSTALDSLSYLYDPFEMPREPDWLEPLKNQIETGISGPDMLLVSNVDYFGRILYNNLTEQINLSGAGSDWDPGEGTYLIERLKALIEFAPEDQAKNVIKSADKVGKKISDNIHDVVKTWSPEDDTQTEVPYANSVVQKEDESTPNPTIEIGSDQPDTEQQTQNNSASVGSTTQSQAETADSSTTPTSLDDFY